MAREDIRLATLHFSVLLTAWLAGTIFILLAPALLQGVKLTEDLLAGLHQHWLLYTAGYGLFLVADCAIALLGVPVMIWLREEGYRGPAILLLFALSGIFGALMDLQMLAASQLFRNGSPLLEAPAAGAFIDWLNTMGNWLSAVSFLPPALACWLIATGAARAGASRPWIHFTRLVALYQLFTGLLAMLAFLWNQGDLLNISAILAVIILPLLTGLWLLWMLGEMKRSFFPPTSHP